MDRNPQSMLPFNMSHAAALQCHALVPYIMSHITALQHVTWYCPTIFMCYCSTTCHMLLHYNMYVLLLYNMSHMSRVTNMSRVTAHNMSHAAALQHVTCCSHTIRHVLLLYNMSCYCYNMSCVTGLQHVTCYCPTIYHILLLYNMSHATALQYVTCYCSTTQPLRFEILPASVPVPSPDKWGGLSVRKGIRDIKDQRTKTDDSEQQRNGPQSLAALWWAEGAKNPQIG